MAQDVSGSTGLPTFTNYLPNSRHVTPACALPFAPRSDLSHYIFENLTLSEIFAKQSLFPGVIFRNCIIKNSDFSRCDFEGARFECCTLSNVTFDNADFRTTGLHKCELKFCTFSEVLFNDNTLKDCELNQLNFEKASLFRTQFRNCVLTNWQNEGATFLHTHLDSCHLTRIEFANCTASYTIFDACSFTNFSINADALGLTYGLSAEDIPTFGLVFLGQEASTETPGEVLDFAREYRKRGWILHELIFCLNFELFPRLAILNKIIDLFVLQIREAIGLKRDDVDFVLSLFDHLRNKERLAFSVPLYASRTISEIPKEDVVDHGYTRILEILHERTFSLFCEMYEEFLGSVQPILHLGLDTRAKVELEFTEKQPLSFSDFIDTLQDKCGVKTQKVQILEARQGSWVEIAYTTIQGLFTFHCALYLINGSLSKIIEIRDNIERLSVRSARRLPIDTNEGSHQPLSRDHQKNINEVHHACIFSDPQAISELQQLQGDKLKYIKILSTSSA